jgi:hypothetical protein
MGNFNGCWNIPLQAGGFWIAQPDGWFSEKRPPYFVDNEGSPSLMTKVPVFFEAPLE